MHPAGSWNLTSKFVTVDDNDYDDNDDDDDGETDHLLLEIEIPEDTVNVFCGVSVVSAVFDNRLILSKAYRTAKALLGLFISQPSPRAKLVKQ